VKGYSPLIRIAVDVERFHGMVCGRCSHVQKVPNEEQGVEYHRCMIKGYATVSDVHTCDSFESQFGEEYD